MKHRRVCSFPGCSRKTRNKGKDQKGNIIWGLKCSLHHSNTHGNSETAKHFKEKYSLDNGKPCVLCGWDKAPCDRHRIVPENGYTEDNVMVVCPNCHRLLTLKII